MRRFTLRMLATLLAVFLSPRSFAHAQDSSAAAAGPRDFHTVDRVVAVGGAKPILLTRLQEEVNIFRSQGAEIPTDSAQLAAYLRDILVRLVNEELVVQAAQRDTAVQLSLPEVQASVDEAVKNVRSQYTSDLDFQRQLRLAGWNTLDDYRQWIYDQKRRENLSKQFVAKLRQKGLIKPIPATEAESRVFYEKNKGQLPHRPATVVFHQIVARAEPDSAAVAEARQRA